MGSLKPGPFGKILLLCLAASSLRCRHENHLTISGSLLGSGEAPMHAAEVAIRSGGFSASVDVDPQGTFSLDVPEPGAYWLTAIGVHHETTFYPVYVESGIPVRLRIVLRPARRLDPIDRVSVIGAFNDWSPEEGLVPMALGEDGVYSAVLAAPADTFAYRLAGVQVDGYSLAGTDADYYVRERDYPTVARHAGKYTSVVQAPESWVTVTFDPALLPSGSDPLRVDIDPSGSKAARLGEVFAVFDGFRTAARSALLEQIESGRPFSEFDFDNDTPRHEVRDLIVAERDSVIRRYMLLAYFENMVADSTDSDLARSLYTEVPPTSDLWSLVWMMPANAFASASFQVDEPELTERYVLDAAVSNPDSMVRSAFAAYAFFRGYLDDRAELADQLRAARSSMRNAGYSRGNSDRFDRAEREGGESFYSDELLFPKRTSPERAIRKGNQVPGLEARALPDTAAVESLRDLMGDVTLIDFWATWCGPCIAEMPTLHQAYERFHDRGFEIVSVSMDEDPAAVTAFRADSSPMPWKHLWLRGRWTNPAVGDFEVSGIPRTILVDRSGTILDVDYNLRGDRLFESLDRALPGTAPTIGSEP